MTLNPEKLYSYRSHIHFQALVFRLIGLGTSQHLLRIRVDYGEKCHIHPYPILFIIALNSHAQRHIWVINTFRKSPFVAMQGNLFYKHPCLSYGKRLAILLN